MAEKGITRMPVVDPETRKLLGLISLDDLLKARTRRLEEERHREQHLRFPFPRGGADGGPTGAATVCQPRTSNQFSRKSEDGDDSGTTTRAVRRELQT
jgi:hypothetical protein